MRWDALFHCNTRDCVACPPAGPLEQAFFETNECDSADLSYGVVPLRPVPVVMVLVRSMYLNLNGRTIVATIVPYTNNANVLLSRTIALKHQDCSSVKAKLVVIASA
mmetsp:Transcript_4350/g.12517  ORF Transcript_4350/g.12517 Transcript_4350/m.12517 type:complete len:107 (+) Transcript_4350:2772-3092(+)